MNEHKQSKLPLILLLIAFITPVISVTLSTIGQPAEVSQYAGLQVFLMGVYNFPLILLAGISLVVSSSLHNKGKFKNSDIAAAVSILISSVSIIGMTLWALGGLIGL